MLFCKLAFGSRLAEGGELDLSLDLAVILLRLFTNTASKRGRGIIIGNPDNNDALLRPKLLFRRLNKQRACADVVKPMYRLAMPVSWVVKNRHQDDAGFTAGSAGLCGGTDTSRLIEGPERIAYDHYASVLAEQKSWRRKGSLSPRVDANRESDNPLFVPTRTRSVAVTCATSPWAISQRQEDDT
jgi:hypothetical protein